MFATSLMYKICNRCSPVHGFFLAPQPLCAENSKRHSEYEAKAADQVNWMNSLTWKIFATSAMSNIFNKRSQGLGFLHDAQPYCQKDTATKKLKPQHQLNRLNLLPG